MTMKRVVLIVGLVLGALGAGCGSSSSDDNGGAAGSGGGSTGGNSSTTSRLACAGGQQGSCKEADYQEYGTCIANKCDTQYKKCLGSNYAKGDWGGACGSWMGCIAKCSCGDTACTSKCGVPDSTCASCLLTDINGCVMTSGCKQPACAGSSTPVGMMMPTMVTGTCSDLQKCCSSLSGTDKSDCMAGYDQAKAGGDTACGVVVSGLKAAGRCK